MVYGDGVGPYDVRLIDMLGNEVILHKNEEEGGSDMAKRYEVAIKVISQKGTCEAEHKVGEEWVVNHKTQEGICISAFGSLFPSIRTLMFGGSFPWSNDPDVARVACPDAGNPVVFELRRLRK